MKKNNPRYRGMKEKDWMDCPNCKLLKHKDRKCVCEQEEMEEEVVLA